MFHIRRAEIKKSVGLFGLIALAAMADVSALAQSKMHYLSGGNAFPVWQKITVSNSGSNFTVTCVPATANCGTATVAKAAALTQSVTLYALPANGYIAACPQIKTTTAFAGTPATLTATLGTTESATFFLSSLYNLLTAASNTNFAPATGLCPGLGSTTRAGTNVLVNLIATVGNVSTISSGAVEVQLLVSVIQ